MINNYKTLAVFILTFFLSACSGRLKLPENSVADWEYRKITYEAVTPYTYPFEILLPEKAEVSFSFNVYADVMLKNEDKTVFFFNIRPANRYKTIEREVESYCDEREKIRNTEIIPLKTFSDYKTYKALLSCTTGDNYLVELNNGKYFYFAIYPKSGEKTEPVLQHILNNLKITPPAIQ